MGSSPLSAAFWSRGDFVNSAKIPHIQGHSHTGHTMACMKPRNLRLDQSCQCHGVLPVNLSPRALPHHDLFEVCSASDEGEFGQARWMPILERVVPARDATSTEPHPLPTTRSAQLPSTSSCPFPSTPKPLVQAHPAAVASLGGSLNPWRARLLCRRNEMPGSRDRCG